MRILPACVVLVVATGCVPPFSEMQGARLTGVGRKEFTPTYTVTSTKDDGGFEGLYNNYGLSYAIGIDDKTDFRIRFERSVVVGEPEDAFNVIGMGPKFSLVRDRVAFYVPTGVAFGRDMDMLNTLQVHPTLLFTTPLGRNAELNWSAKAMIPLASPQGTSLAANFGLALGNVVSHWVIRPEIGFLWLPGENIVAMSTGLGMTVGWGKPKAIAP